MKRLISRIAIVLGAVVLAGLATAGAARFADGPIFVFPGGPLESGALVEHASVDWGSIAEVREIEFQLETPPVSRTTWFIVHDDVPYIPCGFCTNTLLKRWPRQLEADDRVVVRVGEMRIPGRARRVEHRSDEFDAVGQAANAKYGGPSNARDEAENRAADTVVGAVDLAEQALDASDSDERADYWLFRIDPR